MLRVKESFQYIIYTQEGDKDKAKKQRSRTRERERRTKGVREKETSSGIRNGRRLDDVFRLL